MGLNHSPNLVTNGMVLCLDALNTKSYPGSGTTWNDLSGYGHTGTLTNGPTFSSNGINCDGVDDYITIAETAAMQPQVLSFEVWMKFNSTTNSVYGGAPNTSQYPIFRQNTRTTDYTGYMLHYDETGKQLTASLNTSAGAYYSATTTSTVNISTIFHFVATYDTSLISTYFNGKFETSGAKPLGIDYNTNHTLKLGRAVPTGVAWDATSNCTFYAFRLYNKVLTATEVSQNFNALRGRFGL